MVFPDLCYTGVAQGISAPSPMRYLCLAALVLLVECYGGMLQEFVEKVERGDLVLGHFRGSEGVFFSGSDHGDFG